MSEEIKIHKTTLLMFAVFLAAVVAAVGFFATGSNAGASGKESSIVTNPAVGSGNAQDVYLKATSSGYDKRELTVKKGIPVRLHFTAVNAGCGSLLVIYGLDVKALSKNGQEAVVEFTPTQEGTYQYSCGMRMFPPGNFIVTA
jgi:plastocyanin domain-containing protein